eukprot:c6882_g1_i1.p2 GENE.c6882_g1_i1~~c6882_g1_i1.p2  ORF type:complete len:415 (-),score=108.57 c6882_g1_i1:1755-2999(-)
MLSRTRSVIVIGSRYQAQHFTPFVPMVYHCHTRWMSSPAPPPPPTSPLSKAWVWIKEGAWHYWMGSRLLVNNVKISSNLLVKSLYGVPLSRREDKLLRRTTSDLLRLIPFSAFVIIPFMEFLLPVALKLFPNMLPSTFEDAKKKEQDVLDKLKIKMKMADILQQSVKDMADELQAKNVPGSASAAELAHFMEKVRNGELVNNAYILRFSKLFVDEFTLDNLSRPQLVAMCKYMNLNPYGTNLMLRVSLERKLMQIRADDKEISWEGVKSLSYEELQSACLNRGMRPHLPREQLEQQLEEWLDLSKLNVPTSLMILSRIFMITGTKPAESLATAMVSLPEEMVEEIVMEKRLSGADKTLSNAERLEYFMDQMEKIREEEQEEQLHGSPVQDKSVEVSESQSHAEAATPSDKKPNQ